MGQTGEDCESAPEGVERSGPVYVSRNASQTAAHHLGGRLTSSEFPGQGNKFGEEANIPAAPKLPSLASMLLRLLLAMLLRLFLPILRLLMTIAIAGLLMTISRLLVAAG